MDEPNASGPPNNFPGSAKDLEVTPAKGPVYDLLRLPNPPDTWTFLGVPVDRVGHQRVFKAAVCDVLVKHHLWGIRYKPKKQRGHKQLNWEALWKLFYYMADQHRPKTWSELFDVDRDAGPRLLKYTLKPVPAPVSQRYPKVPPKKSKKTQEDPPFVRPADAPDSIPDSYLKQFLLPAQIDPEEPVDPGDEDTPDSSHEPSEALSKDNKSDSNSEGPVEDGDKGETPAKRKRLADNSDYEKRHKRRKTGAAEPAGLRRVTRAASKIQAMEEARKNQTRESASADPFSSDRAALALPEDTQPDVPMSDTHMPDTHMPDVPMPDATAPDNNLALVPLLWTPLPPVFDTAPVKEAVERTVMKIVYARLDRHRDAPIRGPVPYRIAQSAGDLETVQTGVHTATTHVRLDPNTFQFDQSGYVFKYSGRGPVWSNNSCAIDAVIVMGMLLDAGCTVADREGGRAHQYSDFERAYIEVTNMNWDAFDDKVSVELRDTYFRILSNRVPWVQMGSLCPAWTVWAASTKNFGQFQFQYSDCMYRCPCMGQSVVEKETGTLNGSCAFPPFEEDDKYGVSVSTLMRRIFPMRDPMPCGYCGAPFATGGYFQRRLHEPPLRLVVTMNDATRVFNHTDNLKFDYADAHGQPQVAHYRWLGGIYFRQQHARLYWTDDERGEKPSGAIRMYDGYQASGVIVGGIAPSHPNDRVPTEWVLDGVAPILVYERVMNPSAEILGAAFDAIVGLGQAVEQNRQFLLEYQTWAPRTEPAWPERKPRLLPSFGDHFMDTRRPDPFDVLPEYKNATSVEINNWISLQNIDAGHPRLLELADQMSSVPTSLYPPQPVPADTNVFDSLLGDPSSLADQSDIWPTGPPDEHGTLNFPELPQTPGSTIWLDPTTERLSRPGSSRSIGSLRSNSSRGESLNLGDWLHQAAWRSNSSKSSASASKESAKSARSARSNVTMADAQPGSGDVPMLNRMDHIQITTSFARPSELRPGRIHPKQVQEPMRKTVLIKTANLGRKRGPVEESTTENGRKSQRREA